MWLLAIPLAHLAVQTGDPPETSVSNETLVARIRGMRNGVVDVLDLLANGLTAQQVLEELPDLEPEDIRACVA